MENKERVKAYGEDIERTNKSYDNEITEEIFPELKENKDERIKKAIIEFFESEDDNTTYSLVRKKDIIAWLEKQGKEEYVLKSFKDEDVRKFMQYIEKQAKAYEFNLPNRSYDIYAFAKDLLVWLEKQGKQEQLYIRFGEIPTDEKSKIYRREIEVGIENGVSVYPAFKTNEGNIVLGLNLPITKTTLHTQQHLIEYDNRPCYLVKGDYIGKDTDGQSLINNVSIIEKIDNYRVKEKIGNIDNQNYIKPINMDKSKFRENDWLGKKGKQNLSSINERTWLYLVSDVLTWKDGIGQYLDDPRVQELAKRLCNYYAQKLYNPSVLSSNFSSTSNTGKNERQSDDKIESKFHKGDWITIDKPCQIINIHDNGNYIVQYCDDEKIHELSKNFCKSYFHFWTIQDANDGDIIHFGTVTAIFKKYIGREKCICYCSFCKDGGFEIPIENGEDNVYGCYNATPATKEQRDFLIKAMNDAGYKWNTKTNTLEKLAEPKFDPNTLQPFDKVLVRNFPVSIWQCGIFSHQHFHQYFVYNDTYKFCIPYNNDTKYLIGTTDEAPEYYRYWED